MLAIAPRLWPASAVQFQAVLATSANALPALQHHRTTPLLAVGDATAAQAASAGFASVESAGRDADALADLVLARCTPDRGPLLLASGAGQGLGLAATLRARGFTVHRRIAYRAQPVPRLPETAAAALAAGNIGYAMFFSGATAKAFVACIMASAGTLSGQFETIEALVISQAASSALSPLPWRRIRVASHPNQDELVALLT